MSISLPSAGFYGAFARQRCGRETNAGGDEAGDGTGGSTAFRDGRGGGEGMRAPHEVMAGDKLDGATGECRVRMHVP